MSVCLFSCLNVCMNTQILVIVIPRDNKFGMSITIYQKKLKMFLKNGCQAHKCQNPKFNYLTLIYSFIFGLSTNKREKGTVQLWKYNIID